MVHFDWDSALETGNDEIDRQHKRLFALANALQDAIESDSVDEDTIEDAVFGLTDYVTEHFFDEEALMRRAQYPALPTHRGLHEQLTEHTLKITARYFNEHDVAPADLAPFLTTWLTGHIRQHDMALVAYLHERYGTPQGDEAPTG